MKASRWLAHLWFKALIPLALAALGALALFFGLAPQGYAAFNAEAATNMAAATTVHDAWRNILKSGEYRFTTQLEQIVWPAPKLTNVGRSSQRDTLYIEGQANLPQETFNIKLWENTPTGDVFNPNATNGVEIQIVGETAQGRAIGSEQWQPVDNLSNAFAPGGDAAAYLAGASNVRELPAPTAGLDGALAQVAGARRFAFEVNGVALAEHIRAQLEQRMRDSGELPPGLSLDAPDMYRNAQGGGEVWVDGAGLPVRLQVSLLFPQEANGQRTQANITTSFSDFNRANLVVGSAENPTAWQQAAWLQATLTSVALDYGLPRTANGWGQWAASLALALGLVALVVFAITRRAVQRVYTVFALFIIFSLTIAPLLQTQQAYAYTVKQQTAQKQDQAQRATTQAEETALQNLRSNPYWNPQADPLEKVNSAAPSEAAAPNNYSLIPPFPAAPGSVTAVTLSATCASKDTSDVDADGLNAQLECQLGSNPALADTDSDTLNDGAEYRLGTSPLTRDSDEDWLTDDVEVKNATVAGGQSWFSNPMNADSNNDGLLDVQECLARKAPDANGDARADSNSPTTNCPDTDADGLPDLFDDDNDGDGVVDNADLSPQSQATGLTRNTPFKFSLTGLAAQSGSRAYPLMVEIQGRPLNATHLGFINNVLDWPTGDTEGNVQENHNKTFADFMTASARAADPSAANGDLRLMPMLEMKLGYENGAAVPLVPARVVYKFAENGITGTVTLLNNVSAGQPITSIAASAVFSSPTPYTLTVETTSCATASAPQNRTATLTNFTGAAQTIANVYLTQLADSAHTLRLSTATQTACLTLFDIPNLGQAGKMVDTAWYEPYGIAFRDVTNSGSTATTLMAYVPLYPVNDSSGVRVALSARLPLRPDNISQWGRVTEARLTWLVQMMDANGYTDLMQTYYDDWTLTGFSAREDRGLQVGLVAEDPTVDNNREVDDRLYALNGALQRSFLGGRADVTIADVYRRFDQDTNGTPITTTRWGLPDVFQVFTYTLPTQEDAGQVMQTYVPGVLSTLFLSGSTSLSQAPALLILQENTARTLNLEDSSIPVNGAYAFSFANSPVGSMGSLTLAPYRRQQNQWVTYPIKEYWDHLELDFQGVIDTNGNDEEADAGESFLMKTYVLNSMLGLTAVRSWNSVTALPNPIEPPADASLTSWMPNMDRPVFIIEWMTAGIGNLMELNEATPLTARFKSIGAALRNRTSLKAALQCPSVSGCAIKGVQMGRFAPRIAITVLTSLNYLDASKQGQTISAVLNSLDVVRGLKDLKDAVSTFRESIQKGIKVATRAAAMAAVIGAVIGIGIAVGAFIYQMVTSGVQVGSLDFNNALAGLVVEILVAVFYLVLTLAVPIGPLISAVLSLFDALVTAICAVVNAIVGPNDQGQTWSASDPVGKRFCQGFTGMLSVIIKTFIYNQRNIVGNLTSPNRLQTFGLDVDIAENPARGFVAGAPVLVSVGVTNTILRNTILKTDNAEEWQAAKDNDIIPLPFDPLSLPYFWQFSDANAKKANFIYELSADGDKKIHDGLELNPSNWGGWTAIGNRKFFITQTVQGTVSLGSTGINQPINANLLEGYAVPVQECFLVYYPPLIPIPVCAVRAKSDTKPLPLGQSLKYDVFPPTLDGFYAMTPTYVLSTTTPDEGYTLAWGQSGDLTFARQKDFDGDGLLNKADDGNDPNDSLWDTDSDTLSDAKELSQGTNPTAADSDGDGVSDAVESRWGTNPMRADTDGDGLTDKQESPAYQNAATGGWSVVYGATSAEAAWLWSDPLKADTDGDGLSDFYEKIYGFSPYAQNDPNVLTFAGDLREVNAPRTLLRFDETTGARDFNDQSGWELPAKCAGDSTTTCPTAGAVGRYGNALNFDGVDDYVALSDKPMPAKAFTFAAWVYWRGGSANQRIFDIGGGPTDNLLLALVNAGNLISVMRRPGQADEVLSGPNLPANAWAHVAFTLDGSANLAKIYLNGVQVASGPINGDPNQITQVNNWLGRSQFAGDPYFNGLLDEVAIFPRALSQSEIQNFVMTPRYNTNDLVVARNDTLSYTAVLRNELYGRYAQGLFSAELPPSFSASGLNAQAFVLQPQESKTLSSTVTVSAGAASGVYTLTQAARAAIVDLNSQSGGTTLYLSFDDTLNDSSGQTPARNGTCNSPGCPTYTTGIRAKAAYFDGTNDMVTVTNVSALNPTGAIAISAWISTTDTINNRRILQKGSTDNQYRLLFEGGLLKFHIAGVGSVTAAPPSTGAWHQIVGVYNGTAMQLWVDGLLKASTPASGAIPVTANPLYIGTKTPTSPASERFLGQMDEVRFFSRALSANEVSELYNTPLVAYDFGPAVTANNTPPSDTSGNNNYGVCPNSAYCPGRDALGITGGAGRFNGAAYFQTNSAINLTTGKLTFMFWLKPNGVSTTPKGVFGSVNELVGLETVGNKLRFGVNTSDRNAWYTTPDLLTPDQWQHVVVTFDKDADPTTRVYINGVEKASANFFVGQSPNSSSRFEFGRTTGRFSITYQSVYVHNENDGAGSAEVEVFERQSGNSWNCIGYRENLDDGGSMAFGDLTRNYVEAAQVQVYEDDSGACVQNWSDDIAVDHTFTFLGPIGGGSDRGNYGGVDADLEIYWTQTEAALPFSGNLDDVAIYNRAWAASEIDTVFRTRADILNLPLDEPPATEHFRNNRGTTSLSAGTVGFNSADCAGSACPLAGVAGRDGQALRFDGNDYVDWLGNANETNYGVSFWFRTAQKTGAFMYLVQDDGGGGYDRNVFVNASGQVCGRIWSEQTICSPAGRDYADNQWHQVTHALISEGQALYVDGVLQAVGNKGTSDFTGDTKVRLGGPSAAYVGEIDKVKVLNSAPVAPPLLNLPLNEAAGATTYTNTGVTAAPVCGGPCPTANSDYLSFDGVDDWVNISSANANLANKSFTLAFWGRRNSLNTDDWFVTQSNSSGGTTNASLHVGFRADNSFTCSFWNNDLNISAAYADLNWHHWACTYDVTSQTRAIYRDGVLMASQTNVAPYTGTGLAGTHLGTFPGGWGWLNGALDQVVLVRQALVAQDIRTLYANGRSNPAKLANAALLAEAPSVMLHLEETTGAAFANVGGPAATCSANTCPTTGGKGPVGLAVSFDGADDFLTLPNVNLGGATSFTFMAWVYLRRSTTSLARLFDLNHNGNQFLYLSPTPGGQLFLYVKSPGDAPETLEAPGLPKNTWAHVAVTLDGPTNVARIFINGLEVKNGVINADPSQISFVNNSLGRSFNGALDEVSFYPSALSPAEVRLRYTYEGGLVDEREAQVVIVDATAPTTLLRSNDPYRPNRDAVLDVLATDDNRISLVELSVQKDGAPTPTWTTAPVCLDTAASVTFTNVAYCPAFVPNGEGRYTLQTRATDAVGNQVTSTTDLFYVDGTSPNLASATLITDAVFSLAPHPTQPEAFTINLTGTVSDPTLPGGYAGSGVKSVKVALYDSSQALLGGGAQLATLTAGNWSSAYAFDGQPPAGVYTAVVTAQDGVGNSVAFTRTLQLDSTPPLPTLDAATFNPNGAGVLSTTAQLQGSVEDYQAPAGATLELPLEESGAATSFTNNFALNRPASQASTNGGAANLAVDGNPATVAQTANQANPWWQVDLGAYQPLTSVVLYAPSTQSNVQVFASDRPFTSPEPSAIATEPGVWRTGLISFGTGGLTLTHAAFTAPAGVTSTQMLVRYLRVQATTTTTLSISEVRPHSVLATCTSTTCPTTSQTGIWGNAVALDGVDDFVTLPANVANVSSFSFSAWVYAGPNGPWPRIFDFGNGQSEYLTLALDPSRNLTLAFRRLSAADEFLVGPAFPLNTWTHVVFTLDGPTNVARFYLDGKQVTSGTINGDPNQVAQTLNWLGRSQYAGDPYFNGKFDEVRVYHRILTTGEINTLARRSVEGTQTLAVAYRPVENTSPFVSLTPFTNTTLQLNLDDSAPQTGAPSYKDLSPYNRAVTCTGTTCPTLGQSGVRGSAANFDGVDDYLTLPPNLASASSLSFAAWVYWRGGTPNQHIFNFGSTPNENIFLTPNNLRFVIKRTIYPEEALNGGGFTSNRWNHVAVTLDGPTNIARIYLNGNQVAISNIYADPNQVVQTFSQLGKSQAAPGPMFNGKLDEVYVLTRTLTLTEVRSLYIGPNPLLELNFEDGKLRDSSAWNLTLAANDNQALAQGQVGKTALSFNGSTNWVSGVFSNNTNPLSNASFTVAFWAKRQSLGTFDLAFTTGAYGSTNQYVHIGFRSDNTFTCAFWGNDLNTAATYTDSNWHHWACAYDATTRQRTIYRDGVAVASGIASTNFTSTNATYVIGSTNTNQANFAFHGSLDNVVVYPRPLTAAETRSLMLRAWQPATLATVGAARTTWSATVPAGLEGVYAVDLRATDATGLTSYASNEWVGNLDTLGPRTTLTRQHVGTTATGYSIVSTDFNLSPTVTFDGGCALDTGGITHYSAPWYTALSTAPRPYSLSRSCSRSYNGTVVNATVQDLLGNPTTVSLAAGLLDAEQLAGEAPTNQSTLAALVLTPTQGLVLTTTALFTVEGTATAASDVVQALTLTVNGEVVATATPNLSLADFALAWTPPGEGRFELSVKARDNTGATYTTRPMEVYVDLQAPVATIATAPLAGSALSNGSITFGGDLTEANPTTIQLEVGNDIALGVAAPNGWSAAWQADLGNLPDGVTYPVTLTVVDIAGNVFTSTANVLVDVLAPAAVDLTVTADGVTPLEPGSLITAATPLTLTWSASTDGNALSHYTAGWQVALTDTAYSAFALTNSAPAAARQRTLQSREGSAVYAIVTVYDVVGNNTTQVVGPFYVDSALAPDYTEQAAWMDAGCAWLGSDARLGDPAQKLYFTWNSADLKLAWTGANWDTAGDLFIYFDSRPGGSQHAYDPYPLATRENIVFLPARGGAPFSGLAPAQPQQLSPLAQRWLAQGLSFSSADRPVEADYVLWVSGTTQAQLLQWDETNGAWAVANTNLSLNYGPTERGSQTDLALPFSALGITDPAHNPLAMVAFASEDTALKLWATLPNNNPVSSARLVNAPNAKAKAFALTTAFTWPNLGEGVCQNGTQPNADSVTGTTYTDATVDVTVNAEPSGLTYRFLGGNLFTAMSQLPAFAADADWAAAQAELCAAFPDAAACGRASNALQALDSQSLSAKAFAEPLLPSKTNTLRLRPDAPNTTAGFDPYANLSDLLSTNFPPVGNGQLVTYTYHFQNNGSTTAYAVKLRALTFGPLRLTAGTAQSDPSGEFYTLEQTIGDLAPGAAVDVVIAGVIDYTFDAGNLGAGLANLDVVVYDSRGTLATNQQEWAFASYRLDRAGPYTNVLLRQPLIGAGPQTQTGVAFDGAAITALEMEVQVEGGSTTVVTCPLPESNGAWACDWDATGAANDTVYLLRARATDQYGQVGAWSNAVRLTVDATAPTVTFSPETTGNLSDGLLGPAELNLNGTASDNRLIWALEKCAWNGDQATCAPEPLLSAPALPQTDYRYSDTPAAALALGAGQACYSGQEINRIIHVPDNFTVAELAVGLRIAHPYRYDVSAWLQAPSGTWIPLLWNTGVGAANYDVLLTQASGLTAAEDTGTHDLSDPAYENVLRPVGPLGVFTGQQAQGDWVLTLCDYVPAADSGTYQQAELFFTSNDLPQATSADWGWTHVVTEALDYVGPYTYTLAAEDSLGLRSEPLTATFYVDNVSPAIAVTKALTEFALSGVPTPVLTGTVTDGGAVAAVFIEITYPNGLLINDQAQLSGSDWTYALDTQQDGNYTLVAVAVDSAGNATRLDSVTIAARRPAALSVVGSGTPEITTGAIFTHTFILRNTGEYPTTDVWLTDTLPLGATYLSGGTLITDVVVWGPYPDLQPGAVITAEVVLSSAIASGVVQNTVYTATAAAGLSATGQPFFTVIKRPVALSLAGNSQDPLQYGAVFTHTFVITNIGEYLARNLWLTDTLPLNAGYVSGGTLITDSGVVSTPVVVWGPFTELSPEDTITATLVLTSAINTGVITNTDYYLTADDGLEAEGQPFTTTIAAPAALQMLGNGPSQAYYGAPFTHTFVVTNPGGYPAYNIRITDTLPTNARYLSGGTLITDSGVVSTPVVVWGPFPTLQPGAALTVEVVFDTLFFIGDIENTSYQVTADNGLNATGLPFTTTITNHLFFFPFIVNSAVFTSSPEVAPLPPPASAAPASPGGGQRHTKGQATLLHNPARR